MFNNNSCVNFLIVFFFYETLKKYGKKNYQSVKKCDFAIKLLFKYNWMNHCNKLMPLI